VSRVPAALAATLVVALAAVMVSGCGTRVAPTAPTSVTSAAVATSSTPATTTTSTTSGAVASAAPGARVSAKASSRDSVDLTSIQSQLDAMQKELDKLSLPSDKDFNGAAGAVY